MKIDADFSTRGRAIVVERGHTILEIFAEAQAWTRPDSENNTHFQGGGYRRFKRSDTPPRARAAQAPKVRKPGRTAEEQRAADKAARAAARKANPAAARAADRASRKAGRERERALIKALRLARKASA